MERKQILDQYEKYVQAIKNCKDEEIPYNFKKFYKFINKNLEGDELRTFEIASVNETIEELMKREVPFKKVSKAWDSTTIASFFLALNRLKDKKEEWLKKSVLYSVPDDIKILEAKVLRTIFATQDPSMQLFMYKQYRDNVAKKMFEMNSMELAKVFQTSE